MFLIGSRTAEEKTMLNANTKMQLIIGGTAKKKKKMGLTREKYCQGLTVTKCFFAFVL